MGPSAPRLATALSTTPPANSMTVAAAWRSGCSGVLMAANGTDRCGPNGNPRDWLRGQPRGARALLGDEGLELRRSHRAAEGIALGEVAAEEDEGVEGLDRLHPFGDHGEAEVVAEIDDGAGQRGVVL